jgi:hypothetical protein
MMLILITWNGDEWLVTGNLLKYICRRGSSRKVQRLSSYVK